MIESSEVGCDASLHNVVKNTNILQQNVWQ